MCWLSEFPYAYHGGSESAWQVLHGIVAAPVIQKLKGSPAKTPACPLLRKLPEWSWRPQKPFESFVELAPLGCCSGVLGMTGGQNKELFRFRDGIGNGKLAGCRHHGIDQGRSDKDRDFDPLCRRCGIEVSEDFTNFGMSGGVGSDILTAAGAGDAQSERVMAKRRHFEKGALIERLPGQCERPEPAAKAAPIVNDLAGNRRDELRKCASPGPEGGNARPQNISGALVNAMQHMLGDGVGKARCGGETEAGRVEKETSRGAPRKFRRRPRTVAVTEDGAEMCGARAGIDEPRADTEAGQCAEINFKQPMVRARRFQLGLG